MKSIKLTGRALVLAEAIAHEQQTLRDDIAAIEAEAVRMSQQRGAAGELRCRELLNAVYDEIGVPHELRFINHFSINTQHIQHKDAYIDAVTEVGEQFTEGKTVIDRTVH